LFDSEIHKAISWRDDQEYFVISISAEIFFYLVSYLKLLNKCHLATMNHFRSFIWMNATLSQTLSHNIIWNRQMRR